MCFNQKPSLFDWQQMWFWSDFIVGPKKPTSAKCSFSDISYPFSVKHWLLYSWQCQPLFLVLTVIGLPSRSHYPLSSQHAASKVCLMSDEINMSLQHQGVQGLLLILFVHQMTVLALLFWCSCIFSDFFTYYKSMFYFCDNIAGRVIVEIILGELHCTG